MCVCPSSVTDHLSIFGDSVRGNDEQSALLSYLSIKLSSLKVLHFDIVGVGCDANADAGDVDVDDVSVSMRTNGTQIHMHTHTLINAIEPWNL